MAMHCRWTSARGHCSYSTTPVHKSKDAVRCEMAWQIHPRKLGRRSSERKPLVSLYLSLSLVLFLVLPPCLVMLRSTDELSAAKRRLWVRMTHGPDEGRLKRINRIRINRIISTSTLHSIEKASEPNDYIYKPISQTVHSQRHQRPHCHSRIATVTHNHRTK